MKKSISSPCLSSVMPPSPPIKRCTRMNALPIINIDEVKTVLINELQTEAVLHVSGLQAGACALSIGELPSTVLMSQNINDKVKDLASCLMSPSEKEEDVRVQLPRPYSTSYLDLCENDDTVQQRYVKFLTSVRRKKREKN